MGEVARTLLKLLEQASQPVEYDPEWPSPCAVLPPDADNMVAWRPVAMEPSPDFSGLGLRPDIIEFYTSFWGRGWEGGHDGEAVFLTVAWNAHESAQIRASLASQAAAGEPVFIATTDSDLFFGVDNASGAVWLCEPGYPPLREVAPSLAAFLTALA
ncbi:SecY-interacting protein Syd [Massilia rubra]|uniref:SecY-interacting protein Syd n=1 Tax=Massilia rubra TaxID=2607910 RepID=UPI00142036C2